MIIEVFGKQYLCFFLQIVEKVIISCSMKAINVCLLTTNYLKFFCGYLSNIISDLQILSMSRNISNVTDITDPALAAINPSIKNISDHPSIKNIRAKNFKSVFSLTHTNEIQI